MPGSPILSLAEIDFADDRPNASDSDYLVVASVRLRAAPPILRFVPPAPLRSASRRVGTRWIASDVSIRIPPGLEEVSLLVYRVRRSSSAARLLSALEGFLEELDLAHDKHRALERAALERVEVLESDGAELIVSGRGLKFDATPPGASSTQGSFVATVRTSGGSPPTDRLWLIGRELREGSEPASSIPLNGHPYAVLRLGPRSTKQGVREFIDDLRRRHQQRPSGEGGEVFASFVDRQMDKQRKEQVQALFGHHTLAPSVLPIRIEIANDLVDIVAIENELLPEFRALIDQTRASVESVLGVHIPGINVRVNENHTPGVYAVLLDEVPVSSRTVDRDSLLCIAAPDVVEQVVGKGDFSVEETTVPDGSNRIGTLVPAELRALVVDAGITAWDAGQVIMAHVESVLRDNADLFLRLEELNRLFRSSFQVRDEEPATEELGALHRRFADSRGGLPRFAEVARSLLRERLPIVPVAPIVARYFEMVDAPVVAIVEELRLLPNIRARIVSNFSRHHLCSLGPAVEEQLSRAVRKSGDAAFLEIEPGDAQPVLYGIRQTMWSMDDDARWTLVVETEGLRPFVKSLMRAEHPELEVVARREIVDVPDLAEPTVIGVEP